MPNSPVFIISRIILPARFAIEMELAIIRIANGADDIAEFYSIFPLFFSTEFFQSQNFIVALIFIYKVLAKYWLISDKQCNTHTNMHYGET